MTKIEFIAKNIYSDSNKPRIEAVLKTFSDSLEISPLSSVDALLFTFNHKAGRKVNKYQVLVTSSLSGIHSKRTKNGEYFFQLGSSEDLASFKEWLFSNI